MDEHEPVRIDFEIAETRGQITGRVVDEVSGRPLYGIRVLCYPVGNLSAAYCGTTEAYGKYTTGFLNAGAYRLQFVDPQGRYLTEVYDQAQSLETGTDVIIVAGEMTTDINVALAGYPRLSGKVTADDTHAPLSNITVLLWKQDGQAWKRIPEEITGSEGTWISRPLADGVYRVGFDDYATNYRSRYFTNAGTLEGATDIIVIGDQVISGIDAQLRRYSYIAGKVTDQKTGAPVSDIKVYIFERSPNAWYTSRYAVTDANGEYVTNGLPDGVYWLGFIDTTEHYVTEYYADAPNLATATDIKIGGEQVVTRIDAALTPVNQILGTVTEQATGKPLGGIEVGLWRWTAGWQRLYFTHTRPDGSYEFVRMISGNYRIGFSDPTGQYRAQFYANADTIETATDITITKDQTITGIDAALVKAVVEATPTPTMTVSPETTPTATATPEVTPTPTAPISDNSWRVYLPVILQSDPS